MTFSTRDLLFPHSRFRPLSLIFFFSVFFFSSGPPSPRGQLPLKGRGERRESCTCIHGQKGGRKERPAKRDSCPPLVPYSSHLRTNRCCTARTQSNACYCRRERSELSVIGLLRREEEEAPPFLCGEGALLETMPGTGH